MITANMIAVSILPPLYFLCLMSYVSSHEDSGLNEECSQTPLIRSINNFGASLTKEIANGNNVFISPISIYTALAMTYLGAKGQTARQMEQALHLTTSLQGVQLHESIRTLLEYLQIDHDEYRLLMSSGLFIQNDFEVKQKYINDVQNFYYSVVNSVDFASGGEAAKDEINQFVAEKTQKKIEEFLQEPLDPITVMLLLNAIYFNGTWEKQFPEELTMDDLFYKSNLETKSVKLMNMQIDEQFNFYRDRDSNFMFLELYYKNRNASMLLALPEAGSVLNLDMNSAMLCKIKRRLRTTEMNRVTMPRFHLKYQQKLNDALIALGMEDLFTNAANLKGIREISDILVSSVLHEAVIDVNERGTEAVGSTGVVLIPEPVNFNNFVANRPFLFYIIDNRNELILFSGSVYDP